jgi:hypothetical protein
MMKQDLLQGGIVFSRMIDERESMKMNILVIMY